VAFDIYLWKSPRDLDDDQAAALVADWLATGGDAAASPFAAATDVGWFHRELVQDDPPVSIVSDAVHTPTRTPVWLSTTDEPPAKLVAIQFTPATTRNALESIVSLAAKYDLVMFDARRGRIHRPLDEMAAHASANFWPRGAIQAAVAGGLGGLLAVGAWIAGIPLVSGVLVLIGAFLVVMAASTFVHEGRTALRARSGRGSPPPQH
jgi:hypothetical protein